MYWRNLFALISLFAISCSVRYTNRSWSSPRLELTVTERESALAGHWKASADAFGESPLHPSSWAALDVEEEPGGSRRVFGRSADKIDGMPAAMKHGPETVQFRIDGEAGTLLLDGARDGSVYRGTFRFLPDREFARAGHDLLAEPPTLLEQLEFCVADIGVDHLRLFSADRQLRASDVIALKNAGVNTDYLLGMRAAGITDSREIGRLRRSGVTTDFVAGTTAAGYRFSADELVRLRNGGVTADYVAAWKEAGYDFNARDLVRLRNAGVPSSYASGLKGTSFEIRAEDIVRLRNSGVTPEYVQAWVQAGYKLDTRDLVRLRNSGVSLEYAQALNVPGREPLPPDAIIELRQRGVSPETARKLRQ